MIKMPRMLLPPGRKLAAAFLAAAALLAFPALAAPAGQIVVYGAASGSTLTVSTKGQRVVIQGRMAHRPPAGCRLVRGRQLAVCTSRGVSGMEIQMGDSGDFVRIADRLPFPLTVHLGGGSDKFIGNGERDVCYGEGSRRNRCVGGPGDDICISGPRNSDCVGGTGNDYCRTSTGSDGCWGGPGNDICLMGPGQDGCHGEAGNDRLYGGAQPDQLYGGPGYDYCNGGPGWGRSHTCDSGPRR
jgi:Ca2+-binding RTX toxin-like protein